MIGWLVDLFLAIEFKAAHYIQAMNLDKPGRPAVYRNRHRDRIGARKAAQAVDGPADRQGPRAHICRRAGWNEGVFFCHQ